MIVRRANMGERVGVLSNYGAADGGPSVLGASDVVLYGGLALLGAGIVAILARGR